MVINQLTALLMLALGCSSFAAVDAAEGDDDSDTGLDAAAMVAFIVAIDIGSQCGTLDATACAANAGICFDCDNSENTAECVDDDGTAKTGCQIAPSFLESALSADGATTYTSASCGFKDTEETCVVPTTDEETGEEGPSQCEWGSANTCTPGAEYSTSMGMLFTMAFASLDCTADPDACTCSAEDAQLLAAETMEGISTGCMGCVMSAAADGEGDSAGYAMIACMTSGAECPASGCVCSPSDTATIVNSMDDGGDETDPGSWSGTLAEDGDDDDGGGLPDVEMQCLKCTMDVYMDAQTQGEEPDAAMMSCFSFNPCLATDQAKFDELLACAGNDPDGELSPTLCGLSIYLTTSSTCQTCVSMTATGLGFDPTDGSELSVEMFDAIRVVCEPPEPEEVTITAEITLDVDFDEIGSDPTAESYTTFVGAFKEDMATLLGVNEDDITVNSIMAGSVVVDFTIDSTTAVVNAETVSVAFSNVGVEIAGARTTSTIDVDDIVVVSPVAGPDKTSAAVHHNVAATGVVALATLIAVFVA